LSNVRSPLSNFILNYPLICLSEVLVTQRASSGFVLQYHSSFTSIKLPKYSINFKWTSWSPFPRPLDRLRLLLQPQDLYIGWWPPPIQHTPHPHMWDLHIVLHRPSTTFILKMVTTLYTEMFEHLQIKMQLDPKSWNYTSDKLWKANKANILRNQLFQNNANIKIHMLEFS
jgi:hypothetical protein